MSGTRYIENGLMQIALEEKITDEQTAGIFDYKLHGEIDKKIRKAWLSEKDLEGNSLLTVLTKRKFKDTIQFLRGLENEFQYVTAKSSNTGLFKNRRPISPIKTENLRQENVVKTSRELETTPSSKLSVAFEVDSSNDMLTSRFRRS